MVSNVTGTCSTITGHSAWSTGMKINPAIDNLKVVCSHDPLMIKGNPEKWDMQSQNNPVNTERVFLVLDEMAKTLAGKDTAEDAWKTIFQKPVTKEWEKVRVAIKVNCISENHPRVAVVAKVCTVLKNIGVKFENIIVYDCISDAGKLYTEFSGKGLPAGVVISNSSNALGGMVKTDVPEPHSGKFKCAKAIAEGTIDILVNIAVNKGHNGNVGKTTLCMKNHAGTFDAKPIHFKGNLDYIIAFNKSEAILGGTPPRQQLCIVDSLWAMVKGTFGKPDKELSRLVMGTFAPAVDYLTARKIREPLMGATHENLNRFLEDFGYSNFEALDLVPVKTPA